ncbi:type II secretion system protein GspM [Salinisphaera sp. RV14]|uniref:type II secretion system protein GspM n=1 Tax=unclassified Salinisphaera TaxID=2649847 RepID=UPI003F84DDAF
MNLGDPLSDQLKAQLRQVREHPWLGQALLAIAAIMLLYSVLTLADTNQQIAQQCKQLEARAERIAQIADQKQWRKRRQQVSSRLSQLQSQLWQAPTPALAQANLQDKLNMLVRQNNLKNARLQVGQLMAVPNADFRRIKAQLDFKFDPNTLPTVLARLAGMQPQVIFDGLEFHDQPDSRVTLGLLFYFRGQGQNPNNNQSNNPNGNPSNAPSTDTDNG